MKDLDFYIVMYGKYLKIQIKAIKEVLKEDK